MIVASLQLSLSLAPNNGHNSTPQIPIAFEDEIRHANHSNLGIKAPCIGDIESLRIERTMDNVGSPLNNQNIQLIGIYFIIGQGPNLHSDQNLLLMSFCCTSPSHGKKIAGPAQQGILALLSSHSIGPLSPARRNL